MIPRLERVDLIHAVGEVSGGRGPNAVSYGVRTDRHHGRRDQHPRPTDPGRAWSTPSTSIARSSTLPIDGRRALARSRRSRAVQARVRRRRESRDAGQPASSSGCRRRSTSRATSSRSPTRCPAGRRSAPARASSRRSACTVVARQRRQPRRDGRARDRRGADAASFALLLDRRRASASASTSTAIVHRGASGGAGEIGYLEVPRSAAELAPRRERLHRPPRRPGRRGARSARPRARRLADVLHRLADDEPRARRRRRPGRHSRSRRCSRSSIRR